MMRRPPLVLLASILPTRRAASSRFGASGDPVVQVAGGLPLIGTGVLVLTGDLLRLNIEAQRLLDGVGLGAFGGLRDVLR